MQGIRDDVYCRKGAEISKARWDHGEFLILSQVLGGLVAGSGVILLFVAVGKYPGALSSTK